MSLKGSVTRLGMCPTQQNRDSSSSLSQEKGIKKSLPIFFFLPNIENGWNFLAKHLFEMMQHFFPLLKFFQSSLIQGQ